MKKFISSKHIFPQPQYLGNKYRLLDWIWENVPNGVESAYDAFAGSNNVIDNFEKLFKASENIPYWMISYNDKSYPSKDEFISMLEKHRKVKVVEKEYENSYGGKGSKKGTKEFLFLCEK
jgi:adenine-specific DNA methylase